jgi:hypothetical protein
VAAPEGSSEREGAEEELSARYVALRQSYDDAAEARRVLLMRLQQQRGELELYRSHRQTVAKDAAAAAELPASAGK